eukprot:13096056-Alexandrium_andersonii.AAC.1
MGRRAHPLAGQKTPARVISTAVDAPVSLQTARGRPLLPSLQGVRQASHELRHESVRPAVVT